LIGHVKKVLFDHNLHDFMNNFLEITVHSCAELIYHFSGQESSKKIPAEIENIILSLIQHQAFQIKYQQEPHCTEFYLEKCCLLLCSYAV